MSRMVVGGNEASGVGVMLIVVEMSRVEVDSRIIVEDTRVIGKDPEVVQSRVTDVVEVSDDAEEAVERPAGSTTLIVTATVFVGPVTSTVFVFVVAAIVPGDKTVDVTTFVVAADVLADAVVIIVVFCV